MLVVVEICMMVCCCVAFRSNMAWDNSFRLQFAISVISFSFQFQSTVVLG